jgi:hypothetical protein
MKYRLLTENLIDGITGEIFTKDFKEIVTKSNLKRGFKMVESDLLMRIDRGLYRLNPFAYLPYQSDGALLQKEWLGLKENA